MQKYPVYKSLYKTLYFSGVPLLQLTVEIIASIVIVLLGAWLALIPIIAIHIGTMIAINRDPCILSILFDLLSIKKQKGGKI